MKRTGTLRRRKRLRKRRLKGAREITDKRLDEMARAVVFSRDGNQCLRCGSRAHLQWAHVYSRRYKALRWAPGNAMCLCGGCHLWWHHQPVAAARWWIEKFGEAADVQLRATLKAPGKIDRRLTLMWLEQEAKRLGARSA